MSASGPFFKHMLFRGCGKCHDCGSKLDDNLNCPQCKKRRLYLSHGYCGDDHDSTPCKSEGEAEMKFDESKLVQDSAAGSGCRRSFGWRFPVWTPTAEADFLMSNEEKFNAWEFCLAVIIIAMIWAVAIPAVLMFALLVTAWDLVVEKLRGGPDRPQKKGKMI